jgi:hypothetical protein
MPRAGVKTDPLADLPYVIELWHRHRTNDVERVLARATTLRLAREILKAAQNEYPSRRITLRNGSELIADNG